MQRRSFSEYEPPIGIQAVKRGYVRDYSALTDFFREAIERRLRRFG